MPGWYQLPAPNRGAETRERRRMTSRCELCGGLAERRCQGFKPDGTKCGVELCGVCADPSPSGVAFCPSHAPSGQAVAQ